MARFTVAKQTQTQVPDSISALTSVKRGNCETTDGAGLYTSSGQPGRCTASGEFRLTPGGNSSLAACLIPKTASKSAYKDLIAKSGTSSLAQVLSPIIQQDFTGQKQLTLAGHILKIRFASLPAIQKQPKNQQTDARQVSFEGAQLPMASCGAWAVISECESGEHHFAKRLYCGREWCEQCGEDNSASHRRRQARLLPKLQQVKELGYFVIEFPDLARHIGERGISPDIDKGEQVQGWCYSKADLRDTTNIIISVMAGRRGAGGRHRKRTGGYFARGVARWHWFGDKLPGKWNPHLNILVDCGSLLDSVRNQLQPDIEQYRAELASGKQTKAVRRELQGIDMFLRGKSGFLPKPLLNRIKVELREALNCPDLIVHYEKRDSPGKIMHCVHYITRATFRDYSWNQYMAQELYDFRNIRWWGLWKGELAWELKQAEAEGEDIAGLEAVSGLQQGICPDCGKPLRVLHHSHTGQPVQWSQPIDSTYLLIWGAKEIAGTGYYRIPRQAVRFGSTVFSPGEVLRLQELQAKAQAGKSIHPWAIAMRQSVDELWHRTYTYKRIMRRKLEEEWEVTEDTNDIELLGRDNGVGLAIQPKAEAVVGGDGNSLGE
jgi:hypothetical protein